MKFPMHITPDPTTAINDFLWSMSKARSLGMTPCTEHTLAEHLFRRDAKVILYSSMNGVMALVGDDDLFEADDDLLLLRLAAKRKRERTRRAKAVEAIEGLARHFAPAAEAVPA